MLTVRIGDIDFPSESISKMQLVRNRYREYIISQDREFQGNLHIQDINISVPTLVSVRDFMKRFPNVQIAILLPRTRPARDIVRDDLWRWISDLNKTGLKDLHDAAYILGYFSLFDITSLILSEDIDYKSL